MLKRVDYVGAKLEANSFSAPRATECTVSRETNNSRALDAMMNYGLYMKIVIQTLFNRSSVSINDEINASLLTHLELRSILIFKLVSKKLFRISLNIKIKEIPLRSAASSPAIDRNCNALTRPARPIKITKEMINALPLSYYDGPIEVISSLSNAKKVIDILAEESILGFDTETRPAFKKGEHYKPSLIQLASKDKVFIFQLHSMNMEPFKVLFENAKITKVGVGVGGDIKGLKELGSFHAAGFLEISRHKNCKVVQNKGLQSLAAFFLEVRISKNVQLSNWAKRNLTPEQIRYAATDAWISRELHMKLEDKG